MARHGWLAVLFLFGSCIRIAAQDLSTQVGIDPPNPTTNDTISYRLSGTWRDGCVPQSPKVSITAPVIRIRTSNPQTICTQALTPWTLTGELGKLAAGTYALIAEYSGPGVPLTFEIGQKSFVVTDASAVNEMVLPVVVNGAISDGMHYQTIFAILNASRQEVTATLQIYSNAGKPGGVFCSPLAPPPSSVTSALKPNAQLFQFTSADLPFHNGWAHLKWQGPESILASEEISLVAAAPIPCLLVCDHPSTEKLSSTQLPAIKPAREFHLPVTINRYRQPALALINPSSTSTATVKLSILDASGEAARLGVPASFEIQIRPLERISKFLWQMATENSALTVIFPIPEKFQGSVILTSDIPFAAGALNIMFPEGKFVSIPALSLFP